MSKKTRDYKMFIRCGHIQWSDRAFHTGNYACFWRLFVRQLKTNRKPNYISVNVRNNKLYLNTLSRVTRCVRSSYSNRQTTAGQKEKRVSPRNALSRRFYIYIYYCSCILTKSIQLVFVSRTSC